MSKTIIYKSKKYEFDTKEAQKEFFRDLIEAMDVPFFNYLSQTIHWRENQGYIRNNIIKALKEIHMQNNAEITRLRTHFKRMAHVDTPPPCFMSLFIFRRALYKKYIIKLSEETAYRIMRNVVTAYKGNRQLPDSPLYNYPFPYIFKGELFLLKDKMGDEI